MALKLIPNSLAARLLCFTALWTAVALLVTGILLSTLFRQNTERNFDDLLLAHVYNLMGAIEINEAGQLLGEPNLGDPRFLTPLTGWYWVVSSADAPNRFLLRSPAISDDEIEIPGSGEIPFNDLYRRSYSHIESNGQFTQRLEAQLFLGDGDTLFQVVVGANRRGVEETISSFVQSVFLFFTLFGVGTVIATYFVIRLGLRPLERAAKALGDVREGRSSTVVGAYPTEVAPLVGEINGLIEANTSIVERARTQVGNLAHGLKTPLAVIANESRAHKEKPFRTIEEQTTLMQAQIQTYLNRARIAAQSGVITARAPVVPVIERLVRVMDKLFPHIDFELNVDEPAIFAGEEQDLEELLGNLIENAALHSGSVVAVGIAELADKPGARSMLQLSIEDNGAGVSAEQRAEILKRGKRLDEKRPGSGLGLSIVKDIVDEYNGVLELGESSLGGLSVVVKLPNVRAK